MYYTGFILILIPPLKKSRDEHSYHLPLKLHREGGPTKTQRDEVWCWEHTLHLELANRSLNSRSTTCCCKSLGASFWISLSSRKKLGNLQDLPVTSQPCSYPSPFSCVKLELKTYSPHFPRYVLLPISFYNGKRCASSGWEHRRGCASFLLWQHLWKQLAFDLSSCCEAPSAAPAQQQAVLQDSANSMSLLQPQSWKLLASGYGFFFFTILPAPTAPIQNMRTNFLFEISRMGLIFLNAPRVIHKSTYTRTATSLMDNHQNN